MASDPNKVSRNIYFQKFIGKFQGLASGLSSCQIKFCLMPQLLTISLGRKEEDKLARDMSAIVGESVEIFNYDHFCV